MTCWYLRRSPVFSIPVCRYPISGTTLTTVSPSSSRRRRKTPCVDGCCGPILRTMVSPLVSVLTIVDLQSLLFSRCRFVPFWTREGDLCLGKVLPQRVANPPLRHQDAAQVRVPLKFDAEHV